MFALLSLLTICSCRILTLSIFQVHHTSFLKACKSQKAVKEAFRFSKLIRNPSMSTFNMLLSVCASSQDFDGNSSTSGSRPAVKFRMIEHSHPNVKFRMPDSKTVYIGAFQVMLLIKEAGLKPDCKLYTTLISTCAKSGKVDAMFEVW